MKLRLVEWLTLGAAAALAISVAIDAASGSWLARLVWLVLGLGLAFVALIGLLLALDAWSSQRWRGVVLPAIAIIGVALWYPAGQLGVWYRDREFRRTLPAYERVVERFRSGALPQGELPLDSLPDELRACCYRVVGLQDSTGYYLVEFFVGHRFPVRHDAWMYYGGASGKAAARARRWYSGYRVAPHWYRVGD